jgi:hypothetical protein
VCFWVPWKKLLSFEQIGFKKSEKIIPYIFVFLKPERNILIIILFVLTLDTTYSNLHWWWPTLSYIGDSLLCFTLVTAYYILRWWHPILSYICDSLLCLTFVTSCFTYISDSLLYLTFVTAFFSLLWWQSTLFYFGYSLL